LTTSILLPAALAFAGLARAADESSTKLEKEDKGVTFFESFRGSSNTLGQVMKLDTTAGYKFNKYFGVYFGIPAYIVRSSANSTTTGGSGSVTGIGNAYVDLRLTFANPVLNFASILEGTAPTGDASKGFSTGRATFEWANHFDHSFFFGFTPFVNLGVANTISDTRFFTRPFSSLGLLGHFEGGADYKLLPFISVGASAYDIEPSGQQKVFSRLISRQPSVPVMTTRRGGGVFEKNQETTGTAAIDRDNGYSAWLDSSPVPFIDLELGYSRSVQFDLNTVSFSVGFNLGYLIRKSKIH
jgi:hypothetical protein